MTMSFKVKPAKYVSKHCGTPKGPFANRPSVEYTGYGNQLFFDAWGGRFFRSNEDQVRHACDNFIQMYQDSCEEESKGGIGVWMNYNHLYALLGIQTTDFGNAFGISPSEDYRMEIGFNIEELGPGTTLYDQMREEVILVEPDHWCPYAEYWEV